MKNMSKSMKIYFIIIACTALAAAIGEGTLSNYFKDAYQVTAYQRGLIEFPRELPGLLCLFIIAGLSFMSDIRISLIAQLLGAVGILALGLFTPTYGIMLLFVFINSLGSHMFMPLTESIGIDLIRDSQENVGKRVGQYKGVMTGFSMIGSVIVFLGFRFNVFSFTSDLKITFLISGFILLVAFCLLIWLDHEDKGHRKTEKKLRFVLRKEYNLYYILVVMFGVQKQMMIVYGPWVLIDLLGKKADTLAMLGIIGAFIGIFFMPAIGRGLDRFGVKTMLYADALSYIVVYFMYGLLTAGIASGSFPLIGLPVLLVYGLFIIDRMSTQMGMVRTLYLRSILVEPGDLTPTLSLGISMDHVVSIACAYLGGLIWSYWGAQYIFFLAAALSFVNLAVAIKVKPQVPSTH